MLDKAAEEILAFSAFPDGVLRQIWSNNPQERLNRELRRRSNVVFLNREAIGRLIVAVLAEYNEECMISRRYMSLEVLDREQRSVIDDSEREGELIEQLAA